MKHLLSILSVIAICGCTKETKTVIANHSTIAPSAICGCMDSSAENYNSKATKEDSSCRYIHGEVIGNWAISGDYHYEKHLSGMNLDIRDSAKFTTTFNISRNKGTQQMFYLLDKGKSPYCYMFNDGHLFFDNTYNAYGIKDSKMKELWFFGLIISQGNDTFNMNYQDNSGCMSVKDYRLLGVRIK